MTLSSSFPSAGLLTLSVWCVLYLETLAKLHTRNQGVNELADEGCRIEEDGGFMRNRCYSDDLKPGQRKYRCHNSDEYFFLQWGMMLGPRCSNDTVQYQACKNLADIRGSGSETTDFTRRLCERWLCESKTDVRYLPWGKGCAGMNSCKNRSEVDEGNCEAPVNMTFLKSGHKVETSKICNGVCDVTNCEDEANCNGLQYGLHCTRDIIPPFLVKENSYTYPYMICDGITDCVGGEDEVNCTLTKDTLTTCRKFDDIKKEHFLVPIPEHTKCAVLKSIDDISHGEGPSLYCILDDLKKFQTNCTDPARVGGSCLVDGYLTNISISTICYDNSVQVCDDRIESNCWNPSNLCENVHKHRMCDGLKDCEEDNSDETDIICQKQTIKTCERKIGKGRELPLPLAWLDDGVRDCVNGEDEIKELWSACGKDKSFRFVTSNEICENVFVCPWEEPSYVELSELCDGLESCGIENRVCSLSRRTEVGNVKVFSTNNDLVKRLSFCFKGLQSIEEVGKKYCTEVDFIFPDHHYYGVDTKTKIHLPDFPQDCDYHYGEQYVYNSCTNRCKNSSCPLKNWPKYEVCPSQYQNRIATIVNNQYLAFFTKSGRNIYSNRYFVCDNQVQCLDYSKVCDLVYDCKDKSDETRCTNHFKCVSSDRLIPKTKTCDGKFDCFDMSDECNQECSARILQGYPLKVASLIIGSLSVLANLVVMIKNMKSLKKCTTSVALVNKSLIILISFGDLLVGCYLLTIAIYDTTVFRNRYCQEQVKWITSSACTTIGILSTIGSQVSLFAMTGLSTVRLNGIRGALRVPGEVTLGKSLKVALCVFIMLTASVAIAITPIISKFQDFFVNGVKFADELNLFIGTQGKQSIFSVLEAYYGRMKNTTLSWDMSLKMVTEMFSHDAGYVDHTDTITKQEFYGNDGVCLFKYFVDKDDSQRNFVWGILAVNFVCFIFISLSYSLIAVATAASSRKLTNAQNKDQINERNRKMNKRITIIIATDFCCWVPFIIICLLHFQEIVDATPWYSIVSMVILPINSVINPLLYDDFLKMFIKRRVDRISKRIPSTAQSIISRFSRSTSRDEEMEIGQVKSRRDGA